MKAGKSIGKKSAATSGKKAPRKKNAPLSSKGTAKKSSLPAPAKKSSPVTPALSRGKKASAAPPVSTRTTSSKKKPAAEKAKGIVVGASRRATAARPQVARQKAPSETEKKSVRRTVKADPKVKAVVVTPKKKGTARPGRSAAGTVPKKVPGGKVLSTGVARKGSSVKRRAMGRKAGALSPVQSRHELPREYGEDDLTAIVVDPHEVFAHWEIRKEHFRRGSKRLVLRVEEVGYEGSGSHAQRKDIAILQRVGSGFFPLGIQGGQAVLILGIVSPGGRFRPIVTTGKLVVPVAMWDQGDETPVGTSERMGY